MAGGGWGQEADLIGRWDFSNCLLLSCLAKADGEHGWAWRLVLGLQSDEPAAPMSPSTLDWAHLGVGTVLRGLSLEGKSLSTVLGSRVLLSLWGPHLVPVGRARRRGLVSSREWRVVSFQLRVLPEVT